MPPLDPIGLSILIVGALLIGVGLVLMVLGRIPFLGRLPGDVRIRRKNTTIFAPIMTMLLVSLLLSLLLTILLNLL